MYFMQRKNPDDVIEDLCICCTEDQEHKILFYHKQDDEEKQIVNMTYKMPH